MKNIPLLLGTIFGTIALVIGVAIWFSQSATVQNVDPSLLYTQTPHIRGQSGATITIVEFSDFQCPACRAAEPTVQQVLAKYPDKVVLIYRHFPLMSIHPFAELAARASEVVDEQGKFWEYHDKLFEKQPEWTALGSQDKVKDQLAQYAEELGIDKQDFLEKIESDHIKSAVAEDLQTANQLKLQATPTFFVNGQQTAAPQLQSTVESIINSQN